MYGRMCQCPPMQPSNKAPSTYLHWRGSCSTHAHADNGNSRWGGGAQSIALGVLRPWLNLSGGTITLLLTLTALTDVQVTLLRLELTTRIALGVIHSVRVHTPPLTDWFCKEYSSRAEPVILDEFETFWGRAEEFVGWLNVWMLNLNEVNFWTELVLLGENTLGWNTESYCVLCCAPLRHGALNIAEYDYLRGFMIQSSGHIMLCVVWCQFNLFIRRDSNPDTALLTIKPLH